MSFSAEEAGTTLKCDGLHKIIGEGGCGPHEEYV